MLTASLAPIKALLRGKWQRRRSSIKAQDLATGTVFTIRGRDGTFTDVVLKVPFEPNYGSTCASSSFTMVLKYFKQPITFGDVFGIFGLPPFNVDTWKNFEAWVEAGLDLDMVTYAPCTIDHILSCIDHGYPIVVLQHFSEPTYRTDMTEWSSATTSEKGN